MKINKIKEKFDEISSYSPGSLFVYGLASLFLLGVLVCLQDPDKD